MAVDRRDQRLGPGVERAEAVVQRIDQPPLAQPVEPGHVLRLRPAEKAAAVGRDHRGAHGAIGGQAFEQVGELLEQRRIHGVDRRMGQGDDGDAVVGEGELEGRTWPDPRRST